MWSFFQKIADGVKSLAHTVGGALSGAYNETKNIVSGAAGVIGSQLNNVHDEINHVVSGAENVAGNVLKTGENIITNTENKITSIVSTPLLLIGGGLALFLVMNGRGITDLGGKAIDKY